MSTGPSRRLEATDNHPKRRGPGPRLQWVIVDGNQEVHVREFRRIPVGARPRVKCPQCGGLAILKLGEKMVEHAAHRPGEQCAATNPETALHLNAKFHLAKELRGVSRISITEACKNLGLRNSGCEASRIREWSVSWTSVVVEMAVGGRRPDITLLDGDEPIGAIEVFVSHRVDDEKATELASLGIPWIEVRGIEILPVGEGGWSNKLPLPLDQVMPDGPWSCPDCVQKTEIIRIQKENDERTRIEEIEKARHREANGVHIRAVRIVDFYYPSGKKFRDVFFAFVERRDGAVVALGYNRKSGKKGVWLVGPDSDENKKKVSKVFDDELDRCHREYGWVVDSPMCWQPCNGASFSSDLVTYSDAYFERRYLWSDKNNKWFIKRECKSLRWD